MLVVRRPKYACRACEDVVVQAQAPARLIEGGIPIEATVAHVVVAKYADHVPLYCQAQIYARQGIKLDRSTLVDWTGRAPSCSGRCTSTCSRPSDDPPSSSPTRPRPRCSIPDEAAPRPVSSGLMPAMIAPGAGQIRRLSPMSTPPIARPSGR